MWMKQINVSDKTWADLCVLKIKLKMKSADDVQDFLLCGAGLREFAPKPKIAKPRRAPRRKPVSVGISKIKQEKQEETKQEENPAVFVAETDAETGKVRKFMVRFGRDEEGAEIELERTEVNE
jgi:hypothetical protein